MRWRNYWPCLWFIVGLRGWFGVGTCHRVLVGRKASQAVFVCNQWGLCPALGAQQLERALCFLRALGEEKQDPDNWRRAGWICWSRNSSIMRLARTFFHAKRKTLKIECQWKLWAPWCLCWGLLCMMVGGAGANVHKENKQEQIFLGSPHHLFSQMFIHEYTWLFFSFWYWWFIMGSALIYLRTEVSLHSSYPLVTHTMQPCFFFFSLPLHDKHVCAFCISLLVTWSHRTANAYPGSPRPSQPSRAWPGASPSSGLSKVSLKSCCCFQQCWLLQQDFS